jgi:ElaB/YqjD/DUF883 family membrane-anchored ribosome-binding protein
MAMPGTSAVGEGASELGDQLSNFASTAKDKASDLGRTAADKIDDNREAAAGGLAAAASALHDRADTLPGGEKVAHIAHSAADKLSGTADYVRDNDVKGMVGDLERLVKANPGPSLVAAAVLGFLVARAFSSRD